MWKLRMIFLNGEWRGRHDSIRNGLLMANAKWACEPNGPFKEVVENKFIYSKVLQIFEVIASKI
jgi:hypothetical protein